MRNIFLIPTSMESRLWRDLDSNKLTFSNLSKPNSNECTKCSNEYVYITSDEKFVRDEHITDGIEVIKATPKLVDAQGLVNRRDWKKIVMTNDLELIEDGIQEIGDNFFEWLVLNPTCIEVEIGKTNKLIDNYAEKEEDKWEVRYHIYDIHEKPKKNFYCGDEVDYGEQCSFQCENCVDCTGVDYGYLPKEDLGYTTKIGIRVVDGMVRPLMVPKKYFGEVETLSEKLEKVVSKEPSKFWSESDERVRIKEEKVYNNVFHYQTRWLFDWLSKNDYLTDSREVLEKEYKEYLNK
jgi:hypothetical protein